MAVETDYQFSYDDYPRIHMITRVDGEQVSSVTIDIAKSYEQLSTDVLSNFSLFLLDQFNNKIQYLLDNQLNSNKYNELVNPLRNICQLKTDCDKIIYDRENPPENENPFPPLV